MDPVKRKCSMPHCDEEATVPFGMLIFCSNCTAIVCENLAGIRERSYRRPRTDREVRQHEAWLSQNQAFIRIERDDPKWQAREDRSAKIVKKIAADLLRDAGMR